MFIWVEQSHAYIQQHFPLRGCHSTLSKLSLGCFIILPPIIFLKYWDKIKTFQKRIRVKSGCYLEHKDSSGDRTLLMQVEGWREDFERWTLERQAGHWKLNCQLASSEQMHLPFALQPICCFYFYLSHTACCKLSKVFLCLFLWCPNQQDLKLEASVHAFFFLIFPMRVKINWDNNIHKGSKVLRDHSSSSQPQCHWTWASFSRWCRASPWNAVTGA